MNGVIITLCIMLLLAYLGEISSARTRFPTVILLLFLGWLTRTVVDGLNLSIPDLEPILPFLGTIGLILIVLEGALELRLNKSKTFVIRQSFFTALIPMLLLTLLIGAVFAWVSKAPFHSGLLNALPFTIISSSIAIPSTKNLSFGNREFVIYESSLSDILGVLFFNFLLANESLSFSSAGLFLLQILLIVLISIFSVFGLSYLLGRIKNHITYTPIIVLVILVYFLAKAFDLSGLIFILVLGIFLGNINEVKKLYPIERVFATINSETFEKEITKFKAITIEATFLVRSLFFLLFGYLMETSEFLNLSTLPWAVGIVIIVYAGRWLVIKLLRLPPNPLAFFSPRGLITILLFISITAEHKISFINNSLLIQVIILSVFVMMAGIMRDKKA
ncbi:MAG TPA: cation:proton antiporter [Bacteroidales bacterium]|nr:cation:proton antiporter [Bacteroidales bacterium]